MVPDELLRRHALLLGRHDVERQHRQHRAVHGHRHDHLVERDAVEQRAHVVDRIDRHAGHADVAGHARMVAVVAAVGGEVEGDRQALLPGREVAPVEGVGVLGGGEAGVLADRPGLVDVHGRVGAAQIRRDAGIGVEKVEALDVVWAEDRLHRDALGRQPWGGSRCCRHGHCALERHIGKIWDVRHAAPFSCGRKKSNFAAISASRSFGKSPHKLMPNRLGHGTAS